MQAGNDNQILCDPMDTNVDDEIVQLRTQLEEINTVLAQLKSQMGSNSNPELLSVLAQVQEATQRQTSLFGELSQARSCIEGVHLSNT